jgi:hypothetical protein
MNPFLVLVNLWLFYSSKTICSKEFLGAKSTSIRDCVHPSVRPSVRPSLPHDAITWKTWKTRLLREEEEEKTDYVTIPLRRDSFASRD